MGQPPHNVAGVLADDGPHVEIVNIIPAKAGYWTVNIENRVPYPDKAKCDESVLVASLTFNIAE